jgi:formylglycine-generating enzyme required for sulfatase activity
LVTDAMYPLTHPYSSAIQPEDYMIDPNKVDRANHPVVWVTYEGAQRYAQWLGAKLPMASWHQRAAEYSDPRVGVRDVPDSKHYHVPTTIYWTAVREYNKNVSHLSSTNGGELLEAYANLRAPPVGAVRPDGYEDGEKINVELTQLEPGAYRSVWPTATSRSVSGVALFDLIGNVWEWCGPPEKRVICGGSCLSPLSYACPDNPQEPPASAAECDLGFRVAVPCP